MRGAVAGLSDGGDCRGVGHLALQTGELLVVRRDRLDQAILQAGPQRRIALLLRLDHQRGVVELVIETAQCAIGEVEPVTGDHGLRLGEARPGEVKVERDLIRRAEGQRAADVLHHALERVKGRVRQAVGGGGDSARHQQHPGGHGGEHQPANRMRPRPDRR